MPYFDPKTGRQVLTEQEKALSRGMTGDAPTQAPQMDFRSSPDNFNPALSDQLYHQALDNYIRQAAAKRQAAEAAAQATQMQQMPPKFQKLQQKMRQEPQGAIEVSDDPEELQKQLAAKGL